MYERGDGLMRGSREERIQEVFSLHESDWYFHTLLGIIQGFLDHAENVRLAAMGTLLEIAKQKKAPMSLTPVSVIEYFMFSFSASTKAAQRIFRFLVENTDISEANEAIERVLLSDVRNEDFEKFIEIIVEAKKLEFFNVLEVETIKNKGKNLKESSSSLSKINKLAKRNSQQGEIKAARGTLNPMPNFHIFITYLYYVAYEEAIFAELADRGLYSCTSVVGVAA